MSKPNGEGTAKQWRKRRRKKDAPELERYCVLGAWQGGERCFFFFQAGDGIRGGTVTGVQTCALPIFGLHELEFDFDLLVHLGVVRGIADARSEERRVGKECRSRRWRCHCKKKIP